MEPISRRYREHIMHMMAHSRAEMQITEHNILQPGNSDLLPYIDTILEENLLSGSEIRNIDHLTELFEAAKSGESCLILPEHYSNFDLPIFHYLLRKAGKQGPAIADSIIAIAGIKLSETNPVVSAFTEAYSRLVIYPSRSLEIIKRNLKDPKELVAEMMRGASVNHAAMKVLAEIKTAGKLVLVFPAGTRFRPWDPSTKRGVREIDSYVKTFSKMCFVAINGNILRLNPETGEMQEDLLCQDRVVYTVSPVIDCKEFRSEIKHEHRLRDDKKQAVVDEIMDELGRMHDEVEKSRL